MTNKELERVYGFIIKMEYFVTVEKHILPGTFVLKIGKPFPGIYKDLIIRNIPDFYFLVLQENYPPKAIIGASEKINRKCRYGFNAVAGEITISGTTYPVIRIKNIEENDCIGELQALYMEKGFDFNRKTVKIQSEGIVKIIKYFSLERVGEGIYFDRTVPELGYFEIPERLEWDRFKDLTYRIKVNVALGTFDAATGILYFNNREIDIIRIFNPARSVHNLELIQKEYLAQMCDPQFIDGV